MKPRHLPFDFTISGGLDKTFYQRHRALRAKYDLSDKGLFECMLWYLLKALEWPVVSTTSFDDIVAMYKVTPPSEMAIPEVIIEN